MGPRASSDRLWDVPPHCSRAAGSLHQGPGAQQVYKTCLGHGTEIPSKSQRLPLQLVPACGKCFAYRSLVKTGAGMKVSETAEKLPKRLPAEMGTYIRTPVHFLCTGGEWAWGQSGRPMELQNSVCGRVLWRECQTSQETHRIPGDSRRAVGGAFPCLQGTQGQSCGDGNVPRHILLSFLSLF